MLPSALASLKRRVQAFRHTAPAYLFNGSSGKANLFGGFPVDQAGPVLPIIRQEQYLGMPPSVGRFATPIHLAFQLIAFFKRQTNRKALFHIMLLNRLISPIEKPV